MPDYDNLIYGIVGFFLGMVGNTLSYFLMIKPLENRIEWFKNRSIVNSEQTEKIILSLVNNPKEQNKFRFVEIRNKLTSINLTLTTGILFIIIAIYSNSESKGLRIGLGLLLIPATVGFIFGILKWNYSGKLEQMYHKALVLEENRNE